MRREVVVVSFTGHEGTASASSDMKTLATNTILTRTSETVVRQYAEMEMHASNRVSEFCVISWNN